MTFYRSYLANLFDDLAFAYAGISDAAFSEDLFHDHDVISALTAVDFR